MNGCNMNTNANDHDAVIRGCVHSFETLGALDGPGIRTVVFLSGCPMRCVYCHNPDTWEKDAGTQMTADEAFQKIKRYRPYFKEKGGITLSGGEPLLQTGFATELFRLCKNAGIHTALDTSGAVCNENTELLLDVTDLVILDIKHTDPMAFRLRTNYPMEHVLRFLDLCKRKQKRLWIRQVIVPGITDNEENIYALKQMARDANAERIELLPYHTHGVYKWEKLGIPYPLQGIEPPSEKVMERLNAIIKA